MHRAAWSVSTSSPQVLVGEREIEGRAADERVENLAERARAVERSHGVEQPLARGEIGRAIGQGGGDGGVHSGAGALLRLLASLEAALLVAVLPPEAAALVYALLAGA